MKTATKVLLIINLVLNFIFFIAAVSMLAFELIGGLIFLLYYITSFVVGGFSLYRLSYVSYKRDLIGCGVCCWILSNNIAGILMLCMKDSDLEPTTTSGPFEQGGNHPIEPNYLFKNNTTNQPNNIYTPYTNVNSQDAPKDAIIEKLKQLKELKDNDVITEEEFAKMKADLLNKF